MHQSWDTVEDDVKGFKRDSKKARKERDWAEALGFQDRAISSLLHLLTPSLSSTEKADSVERGVAEQLADCYGMKGGIYRHAKNFDASIACYDLGYLYESCPRFKIVNSYNLLNRLLSRLMLEPEALEDEQREVADLRLRPEFEEARKVISKQTKEPPRNIDPWAWGDLAVCTALLLRSPDEETWDEFFELVPSNHAHKTTADTLQMLVQCDESNSLPQETITAAIIRLRQEQAAS